MHLIPLNLEICITMNKIHSSSIFRSVFFTLEIKTRGLLNPSVAVRAQYRSGFARAFCGK